MANHGIAAAARALNRSWPKTVCPTTRKRWTRYSTVVTAVARAVLPSVASLAVRTSRGEGSGSASVITADGYLLTSAHVVAGANSAEAAFTDGTSVKVDVVGRDVLSDLAVLKARGAVPAPVAMGRAEDLRVGQLVVAVGNPLGLGGQRHRRHRVRAGAVIADEIGSGGRRGDSDGRRAQSGQQRRRARRRAGPDGRRQHRGRGSRSGTCGSSQSTPPTGSSRR